VAVFVDSIMAGKPLLLAHAMHTGSLSIDMIKIISTGILYRALAALCYLDMDDG
jgi:hypothetical protein